MTRDEILFMARQAGGVDITNTIVGVTFILGADTPQFLEAFAKLVAAKERDRIIAKNSLEIERCNAHIKMLEDAVSAERDRWMQLFLDPENQPTQFGTATQEYREQEIKAEREACESIEYDLAQSPAMFAKMTEYKSYRDGVEKYRAAIRARGETTLRGEA
jgi:hypothetical protein